MKNQLPTNHFLAITHRHPDGQCPRCHSLEMTIHILRDCPWAKEAWIHSPGLLPLAFFHMPSQAWLRSNAIGDAVMSPTQLPWWIYFPFLCWNLWLARNYCIFNNQSRSQQGIVHSSINAATEYYFLAGPVHHSRVKIPQFIRWQFPPNPFIKLNTDGSAIGNSGLAGARGLLRNSSSEWISGFSLHLGLTSNNMTELATVYQGLILAWDMGFKFIHLELDSMTIFTWLIATTNSYPTNMLPLICDCRNLLARAWEVHVLHVYCEANACADALAKRGAHQHHVLTVYSSCPSFVYVCFVRDMAGLGSNRICA